MPTTMIMPVLPTANLLPLLLSEDDSNNSGLFPQEHFCSHFLAILYCRETYATPQPSCGQIPSFFEVHVQI